MNASRFSVPRHDPRIRVGLAVELRFGWKDSEGMKASVVDMSERGMHVLCRAPLRSGIEVKVVYENAPDEAKVYTVVWVRDAESSGHGFDIGLELKS